MTRAACRYDHLFRASAIEIARGGVSYTIDTLLYLAKKHPPSECELVLIIGGDAAADLPRWRDPERIFELAAVALMDRADSSSPDLSERWLKRIIKVNTPRIDVSSSDIRRRIAEGLSISWLTPAPVEGIIRRNHLYIKGRP